MRSKDRRDVQETQYLLFRETISPKFPNGSWKGWLVQELMQVVRYYLRIDAWEGIGRPETVARPGNGCRKKLDNGAGAG